METILIQDADRAIVDIVIMALRMEGYHACRLTDHHENMLEMIRKHQAKLLILDDWLGKQTVKLCGWIKTHFPKLPVIAFSCDNNISQNYRVLGFDDYLRKPFDLEELYHVVRKFIPQRKTRLSEKEAINTHSDADESC